MLHKFIHKPPQPHNEAPFVDEVIAVAISRIITTADLESSPPTIDESFTLEEMAGLAY
jgi:hypothetical protein